MSKKLIWFVSDFSVSGGGERFIIEGLKVLHKKNVDHKVVCINHHKFEFLDNIIKVEVLKKIRSKYFKYFNFIFFIYQLRKCIKSFNPSDILCQDFKGYVIVLFSTMFSGYKYSIIDFGQMFQFDDHRIIYTLKYKKKIKLISPILESMGEKVPAYPENIPLKIKVLDEIKGLLLFNAFDKCKQIYSLSEKVQKEDEILYSKKPNVIKGAYNEDIFQYKIKKDIKNLLNIDGKNIILSISRLIKNKRIDQIILGFNLLLKERNDTVLIIGGKGPEYHNLKNMVSKLGITEHVFFVGFIEENSLYDYYCSCDVFTTMDNADFDITTYVALALGRNVVWPKVMEIDNNLSKVKNIYQAIPEEKSIKEAFNAAINNKNVSLTNTEINILKKYTWENCFTKIYERL